MSHWIRAAPTYSNAKEGIFGLKEMVTNSKKHPSRNITVLIQEVERELARRSRRRAKRLLRLRQPQK